MIILILIYTSLTHPFSFTFCTQYRDVECKKDSRADISVISQHTYDTFKTLPQQEHSQPA